MAEFVNKGRTCSIDGCEKKAKSRGWCSAHHEMWRKTGDPLSRRPTLYERLDARTEVDPETDCWIWQGSTVSGYGSIAVGGRKQRYVHQVSYERHVGPIPAGLELDHLCRNPPCLNPDHLEPVTHQENILRGKRQLAWERRQRRAA